MCCSSPSRQPHVLQRPAFVEGGATQFAIVQAGYRNASHPARRRRAYRESGGRSVEQSAAALALALGRAAGGGLFHRDTRAALLHMAVESHRPAGDSADFATLATGRGWMGSGSPIVQREGTSASIPGYTAGSRAGYRTSCARRRERPSYLRRVASRSPCRREGRGRPGIRGADPFDLIPRVIRRTRAPVEAGPISA